MSVFLTFQFEGINYLIKLEEYTFSEINESVTKLIGVPSITYLTYKDIKIPTADVAAYISQYAKDPDFILFVKGK